MNVQLCDIIQQKKEIERYADELREVRTKLILYKQSLEDTWVSEEEEGVSDAVDRLNRKIEEVSDEMNRLGEDFIKAYEELLRKEQEAGESA